MTIKDLAAKTGYAVATVSRVLNNHPNVSEKARRAVMAEVEKSGFQLNVNAKQLKQQHATTILVVVKGLPLEIEEAAAIDGCGPVRTFFNVVLPMLKPTLISVGILELMWVWNDYLLPYLVLDRTKYMTIPIHVQYLKGSYGTVDLGATMAVIMLSIIPIIIVYLFCQKHIIKGVAAGAVKG